MGNEALKPMRLQSSNNKAQVVNDSDSVITDANPMIPSINKTKVVEAWRQRNSEADFPPMPAMAHAKTPTHTPSRARSLTSRTSVASPPITTSTIPSRHASPMRFMSPSRHAHGASQPKSAPQAHKSKFTPPPPPPAQKSEAKVSGTSQGGVITSTPKAAPSGSSLIITAGLRLLSVAAIPIQSQVRQYLAQQLAFNRMLAVVIVQTFARRWLAQNYVAKHLRAAIQIQCLFRGWVVRDIVADQHYCATIIQTQARTFLALLNYFDQVFCIKKIQAVLRTHQAKQQARYIRFQNLCFYSAITIQALVRQRHATIHVEELREAKWCHCSILIQKTWRRYYAQMMYLYDLSDIKLVQSIVRMNLAMRYVDVLKNKYATQLQTAWRGYYCWLPYKQRKAAIDIQSIWRSYSCSMKFFSNLAATAIQTTWRSYVCRKYYVETISTIAIQAKWRSHVCYKTYRATRAAISIQSHWRSYSCSKKFLTSLAATAIQSAWRSYKCTMQYFGDVADIIVVQSVVRRHVAKKYVLLQAKTCAFFRGISPNIMIARKWILEHNGKYPGLCQALYEFSATKIQSSWRAYDTSMDFLHALANVVIAQSVVRRWRAGLYLKDLKSGRYQLRIISAIQIQKQWRAYDLSMHYLQTLGDIVLCQTIVRRHVASRLIQRRRSEHIHELAAIIIQAKWRCFAQFSRFEITRFEISRFQGVVRGHLTRICFRSQMKRVLFVQSAYRRMKAEQEWTVRYSARKLTAFGRFILGQKMYHEKLLAHESFLKALLKQQQKIASRKLQRWYRELNQYRKEKRAALIIERFFLMVKREIEWEVKRQERKLEKKRERKMRKQKEAEDKMLERVWLNTLNKSMEVLDEFSVSSYHKAIRRATSSLSVGASVNRARSVSAVRPVRPADPRREQFSGESASRGGRSSNRAPSHNNGPRSRSTGCTNGIKVGEDRPVGNTPLTQHLEASRRQERRLKSEESEPDENEENQGAVFNRSKSLGKSIMRPLTSRSPKRNSMNSHSLEDDLSLEEAWLDCGVIARKEVNQNDEAYLVRHGLEVNRKQHRHDSEASENSMGEPSSSITPTHHSSSRSRPPARPQGLPQSPPPLSNTNHQKLLSGNKSNRSPLWASGKSRY